jgi:hypothetical protein
VCDPAASSSNNRAISRFTTLPYRDFGKIRDMRAVARRDMAAPAGAALPSAESAEAVIRL